MKLAFVLLLAAATVRLDVVDLRGRKAGGVAVEAGDPESDGWSALRLTKSKPGQAIIWPYDARVKTPDGPAPVPVLVAQPGEGKWREDSRAAAAALLRGEPVQAFDGAALQRSTDAFARGVGFLCAGQAADAVEPLGIALRERERQLTRIPSEIYAAAMLDGMALLHASRFDAAAVAFLKALQQRPADVAAKKNRAEALLKAGKPEAAQTP